jgi:hypothetical protein
LLVLALASLTPNLRAGQNNRLAVVVAKGSQVSALSLHEVKRLYLGERVSVRGSKLVPLAQQPRSADRVAFERAALGMTPEQVDRYWIDRRIRGHRGPPKSIDSPELLQRVVAHIRGAVGYVRADHVRSDVKVVRVNGKLPSDAGYALTY